MSAVLSVVDSFRATHRCDWGIRGYVFTAQVRVCGGLYLCDHVKILMLTPREEKNYHTGVIFCRYVFVRVRHLLWVCISATDGIESAVV